MSSKVQEQDSNVLFGGSNDETQELANNSRSFGAMIYQFLESRGDSVVQIDGSLGTKITNDDLHRRSIRLARCLRAGGIKLGDAVGFCSENRFEMTVAKVACFYLGAIVAPFNFLYTEDEMEHAIGLSKPKLIFTSKYAMNKIVSIKTRTAFIEKIILIDDNNNWNRNDVHTMNVFMANKAVKDNAIFEPATVNLREDIALIMCSSGTTGLAKGVQITHYSLVRLTWNTLSTYAEQIAEGKGTENPVFLSVIPWFHIYGCMFMIHTLCAGIPFVFLPRFDEDIFLQSIEKNKVTHCGLVPPLMVFLAKHPKVDKYNLSSMKELLCGAAPLRQEIEDHLKKKFNVIIRQGYGMTETTLGVISQRTDISLKPGSVGVLARGIWGKVIDPDSGKSFGPNKRGELCFKGDYIMKGYVGDEMATKNAIDESGWLHTGDVGYYDDDQVFFVVDRLKELIKYKAYQVPPAELEGILLTHPKIKDAAVIGLPDENSGELPLAFIVKQPNANLTEKEVQDFVAGKVSSPKRLRGGVRFIAEIPKNPSGKILRKDLRASLTMAKL